MPGKNTPMQTRNILLSIILLLVPVSLSAYSKDTIMATIAKTEKVADEISSNSTLKRHIPHDYYSNALLDIVKSRQNLEKKDLRTAYYYSESALIRINISKTIALARKQQELTRIMEIDYLRNNAAKKTKEKAKEFMALGFVISGKSMHRVLYDYEIFEPKSFTLTTRGREFLSHLARIMKENPEIKLTIAGHSELYDYKNSTKKKGKKLYEELKHLGIKSSRIIIAAMGNREVGITFRGLRRSNRVEFILVNY
jgi:outer membrane protein OmpA-like peptidoglycan-associated protein